MFTMRLSKCLISRTSSHITVVSISVTDYVPLNCYFQSRRVQSAGGRQHNEVLLPTVSKARRGIRYIIWLLGIWFCLFKAFWAASEEWIDGKNSDWRRGRILYAEVSVSPYFRSLNVSYNVGLFDKKKMSCLSQVLRYRISIFLVL